LSTAETGLALGFKTSLVQMGKDFFKRKRLSDKATAFLISVEKYPLNKRHA